jgi:hypothetical protein
MSTLRHLLARLGSVGTLLGASVSFASGSPRKTTNDPDEELRAAFEAWARSGSEVTCSTLRSADQDYADFGELRHDEVQCAPSSRSREPSL